MLLRFLLAALLSFASYGLIISPDPVAPSVNASNLLITDSDVYNETVVAFDTPNRFRHGPGLGPGPDLAIDFNPEKWFADDELWEKYVQKG